MVFGSGTKFSDFYHMLLVVFFCSFDHSFGSSGSSNSSIKDLTSQPLKVVELIEYWGYGMNYLLQNAIFFSLQIFLVSYVIKLHKRIFFISETFKELFFVKLKKNALLEIFIKNCT